MIVRVWRCRALASRADVYPRHLADAVLPRLRALPGFRGAKLLRRTVGDETEFVVETFWDSMDAIERFAGSTPDVAVVEPEARSALVAFDTTVRHYDVVLGGDD
jgi:heme-degrading monooxygenase HmoA